MTATLPKDHLHVTERQKGPDTDCLWMSGVEFLRETLDPDIPATHAEGDALRAASGDAGFSNVGDFRRGVAKRYPKLRLPGSRYGMSSIWGALDPGMVAMVGGRLTNMSTHFRSFYPSFTGGHEVYVRRTDDSDTLWWCDPGGPAGYLGEPISKAQFAKFIGNYGFPALVLPVYAPPPPPATIGDDMATITTYIPGSLAVIASPTGGARVRSAPDLLASSILRTIPEGKSETWKVIGWVKGASTSGSDQWLMRWSGLTYEYVAKVNVKTLVAPLSAADLAAAATVAGTAGYNEGVIAVKAAANAVPLKGA